ncbi:MAG: TolC family outer membrane protein [Magnetococcales bacterium]|nr:TolC family outer membrane protein [Magnetococcales bacterium]
MTTQKSRAFKVALVVASCGYFLSSPAWAVSLSDAVAQALSNHPKVSSDIYGAQASREKVGQAYSAFLPVLTASIATGQEGTDSPGTRARLITGKDSMQRHESSLTMDLNLFEGFSAWNDVKKTKAGARAEAWGVMETSQDIALEVAEAFLDVLEAREVLIVAKENLENHKSLLDLVKSRVKQGVGSQAEVSQAVSRVKKVEAALFTAEGDLGKSQIAYKTLVGEDAGDLENQSFSADSLPEIEAAVEAALNNSPAVSKAKSELEQSRAELAEKTGKFFPTLDLELTGSLDRNKSGTEGKTEAYLAMLTLEYEFFSGTEDFHARKEISFEVKEKIDQIKDAELEVSRDLRKAYNDMETSKARKASYAEQATENEMVRNAYFEQYRVGKRTLLDLLDSENEYSSARKDLIVERYKEIAAGYEVLSVMGSLLDNLGVMPPKAAMPRDANFFEAISYSSN